MVRNRMGIAYFDLFFSILVSLSSFEIMTSPKTLSLLPKYRVEAGKGREDF